MATEVGAQIAEETRQWWAVGLTQSQMDGGYFRVSFGSSWIIIS
jgi:hypothetical protein